MKTYGELRYSCTILDLRNIWRCVVSFTPQLLYPQRKRPRYALDKRLGGPQSRSDHCGEAKNLLPRRESNPGLSPRTYFDWAIPAPCSYRFFT
jgi:hypothetical protein